jgi:hypothetical protein
LGAILDGIRRWWTDWNLKSGQTRAIWGRFWMESGGGGQTGWQAKKGKLKMANEKLKMAGAEG